MKRRQRRARLLLSACLLALSGLGRAEAAEEQLWRKEIAALEKRVFDPILSADEVDRLLSELKTPDKRAAAAGRLCEQGQGHVERIVVFAHDCSDIEAREACADVVEALDASYRTTEPGKRLGNLYREHAEELLPAYWAMFRRDPLDRRAAAMLMSGEPYNISRLLAKSGNRHDVARFLLLRIRELSPDVIAADHLDNHTATGLLLVLSDVFPYGACNNNRQVYFGAHRVVGHSYLHVVQLCLSEPLQSTMGGNVIRRTTVTTSPAQSPLTVKERYKQPRATVPQKPGATVPRMNSRPASTSVLPSIGQLQLTRRLIGLCATLDGKVCFLGVDSSDYKSEHGPAMMRPMGRSGPKMYRLETNEGLCPLPKIEVKRFDRLPWYAKPYVPAAYLSHAHFEKPKPGEAAPPTAPAQYAESSALLGKRAARPAAPLDASAPGVVILPPRLPEAADGSVRAEAELLCDRLAEEIAAEGIARVLDRSQMDRVIEEKRLSGDWSKSAVAFDAMIRLEVDVPSLTPEVRMCIIGLSLGNVMSESRCSWPMREDDLRRLIKQCREGLKQTGHSPKGKLKVRCLEAANEERNPRLRALIDRLERVFQEAVARSPQLTPVRHLEAACAKEESLLLLMGLSRLPGGRRFVPQADATIELSVREGDGRGKTFEETPVEITARVIRGDASGDQSFTTAATVAGFDEAAVKTWEKLAGLLREARPAAATDWLDDLAARRRQAEAELRAAKAIDPGLGLNENRDRATHARLAHVEAAVKLDPTLEDAAGEQLRMLVDECFLAQYNGKRETAAEISENILTQALHYLDRFGPRGKYRSAAFDAGGFAISVSLGDMESSSSLELTPRRLRMVRMAKLLLEETVKFSPSTEKTIHLNVSLSDCSRAAILTIVGRAMKRTGVPLEERQRWVDDILRQCASSEAALPKMDPAARRSPRSEKTSDEAHKAALQRQFECDLFRGEYADLVLRAAELAVEDVSMDRVWKLVTQFRDRCASKTGRSLLAASPTQQGLIPRLQFVVMRMDDADRLADFDRWLDGLMPNKPLRTISVRWPEIDVYGDKTVDSRGAIRFNRIPSFDGVEIRCPSPPPGRYARGIYPLVEGAGRLYLKMDCNFTRKYNNHTLSTLSYEIGFLPLDEAGRPVGNAQRSRPKDDTEYWDSLKVLSQPQLDKPLRVIDSKYVAGKLCLATEECGLVIFDEKTEKWSVYGPEQGLPNEKVAAIYPLDDRTLFCVAGARGELICCKLDIISGKVTLLNREKIDINDPLPKLFWRNGQILLAWSKEGLYDDLLGPKIKFTRRDCGAPYGWNLSEGRLFYTTITNEKPGFTSIVEIGGKRYVTCGGIHEFDSAGKIIKSWWRDCSYNNNYVGARSFDLPPDCPAIGDKVAVMGSLLVFDDSHNANLIVWDPDKDIWYGPLSPPRENRIFSQCAFSGVANRTGMWLANNGLLFVSADDFIAAAKKAGRAMTTAEYRRRQTELIAAMPPVDRAKIAISRREFDQAEKILDEALASDATRSEALLLLGNMNEPWCLDRPEMALEYYRRMAEMESNPNASYTGMRLRLLLLRNLKRWPEALEVIQDIKQTFGERLERNFKDEFEFLLKDVSSHLSEGGAKQPPPEPSNK